jgi:UDP-glucose 4-epimerase
VTLAAAPDLSAYRDTLSLVTGGLGFIGSNIVRTLNAVGGRVRVIDSLAPGQGGNRFNLDGIEPEVDVRVADLNDETAVRESVDGVDFVFNLAGGGQHLDSLENPIHDLEANLRGHLVLLEAIRRQSPGARVVYGGSRSEYGLIQTRPVTEEHPLLPTEINSANTAAGGLYHHAYFVAHGTKTCNLRLTNIYGPRMLVTHFRQGFLNWLVRLAIDGETIKLYGDGTQVRDLVYVDDTVNAFLQAGLCAAAAGQTFNVGSGKPSSLTEIAETLIDVTGRGRIEYVPFPYDARRIEIGDYVANVTKIRSTLGWEASVSLREGLERSVRFYRENREHYW